jgi:hypothetical protein
MPPESFKSLQLIVRFLKVRRHFRFDFRIFVQSFHQLPRLHRMRIAQSDPNVSRATFGMFNPLFGWSNDITATSRQVERS